MELNDTQIANANWQRYEYGRGRGHREYCKQARRCEEMFLGGGLQWSAVDRAILEAQRRPAYEFNEVMPSCNSAIGYQIHNRMDISFKPRGGDSDQERAEIRSKVAMQIADDNQYHWHETQVFGDGIIQQRGYFDIRMDFCKSVQGEIRVSTYDPLDVIPDPDAKTYDPDGWKDVIVTRWLTLDEIEEQFGKDKRVLVENRTNNSHDFGDAGEDEARNRFGDSNSGYDAYYLDSQIRRARVIDRQQQVYTLTKVGVWPDTGDVRSIENETPEKLAELQAQGVLFSKRMHKRIKWTVTTYDCTLFNEWSPYEYFTVVPYFAYFRRGKTRGMVDNAIGPQEVLNKGVSQFIHITNTTANSGYMVEENSLTNMETKDLEEKGAQTGLVIEYKQGTTKPEKIRPNEVPQGIDRIIDRATQALKDVTVPDAMRGLNGQEVSGIAIQSKQFASQQQLATPLDNLAHTRHLLAIRMLNLMQKFYTNERIFRITETDPMTGRPGTREIAINQFDPLTGLRLNDMTEGEYDVVITEQPMQATFQDTQFKQAMEMRTAGVNIPDPVVVKHSNLTDKQDILTQMQNSAQVDPLTEAKTRLTDAQAEKVAQETKHVAASTVKTTMDTFFSSEQTAQVIAAVPQTAGIADVLMQQAGYIPPNPVGIDPNIPTVQDQSGLIVEPVKNKRTGVGFVQGAEGDTSPNTPAVPVTPGVGAERGIETMRADSVRTQ